MKVRNHLKALLRKNFILWKRNWICSIFEIFLPAIIGCFFFVIRNQIKITDIDTKSYIDERVTLVPDFQILGKNQQTGKDILPIMKDCIHGKTSHYPSYANGHVALIGDHEILDKLETIFTKNYQYPVKRYQDVEQVNKHVKDPNYNYDLCLGIQMNKALNNVYDYTLFFNNTGKYFFEMPKTLTAAKFDYMFDKREDHLYKYINTGFMTLQNWIDNMIFQIESGDQNSSITVELSSMKIIKHGQDDLAEKMQGRFATYIVLPMIIVYLRMTYGLLIEKEKRIREGMKVMGMSDTSFYLAWIIHYLIIYALCSLFAVIILKTAIFKESDFSVLFVWHFLFGITLIFQSLFITTFFTRAKIGNIIGMVFFLLQYMVIFVIRQQDDVTKSMKNGVSILSHTGTTLACDVYLLIESQQKGITWSNLDFQIENYSVLTNFYMNIINIIIFFVLSIYLDQVFPNEFGKKQHPLFFIRWIWKRQKSQSSIKPEVLSNDTENLIDLKENFEEEVAMNLKEQERDNQVLKVNDLYKVYPSGKSAVNGVTMTMYKDQIFALLGHNGAGKTTTISMLTGMYEFTSGSAVVFGKDVQNEMREIRTFMGVCPQHDILFDDLSVKEHLELFASFKGMTDKKLIAEEVEKYIADVDLAEKRNELSKNLSGGQKRRLSVAIAFIGGSKLIYLDEPTSGMDTSARRHIWDMLKRYKSERIICLTTHFMDEADYLGDRIAIMAEGQIVCMGRPLFLKNKFGAGYHLTIVKKNPTDPSVPIIQFVKSVIPSSKLVSDVSAEVSFQLNNESLPQFAKLFNDLDQQLDKLSVQSYGISITTLEEVFLRVAHLKDEIKEKKRKQLQEQAKQKENNINNKANLDNKKNQNLEMSLREGENNNNINNPEKNYKLPSVDEIECENKQAGLLGVDNFDLNNVRITKKRELFFIHLKALIIKRLIYFKRDIRSLLCEIVLPCIVVIFGLSLALVSFLKDQPGVLLNSSLYENNLPTIVSSSSLSFSQQIDQILDHFPLNNKKQNFEFEKKYDISDINQWDEYNFSKRGVDRIGSYYVKSITPDMLKYQYITELNTIARDSSGVYVNAMNQAIINSYLQYKSKVNNQPTARKIQINATFQPWPLTEKIKSLEGTADGLVSSFIFSIGFSFIPASIITFCVKERTENIKHQQLVSGVGIVSYWASNIIMDMVKHIFPAAFCILMVKVYDIDTFMDGNTFSAIVLLMFLYGWSVIPFTFVTSFLFGDYGNAQVSAFFINFLCGGILPTIVAILRIIESTENSGIALGWIFRIIPSFSFGYGILNIGNRELYNITKMNKEIPSAYELDIAGGDIILMFVEGIVYLAILFLIEWAQHIGSISRYFSNENSVQYIPKEQDSDVQKEIDLVALSKPQDYSVRVQNLRKVFIPAKNRIKVAVDQISFGIKNGECFTLLGVNGAGKTTTFKILSGEIHPTSGSCHINGYDVATQIEQARRNIGYCPQFDALLENLTAYEHLELYAAIKGIPYDLRKPLIKQKIQEMDLIDFENKLAGTYSGGNKRKLSVAIAMLGNPPVVFLDEPSTGMDPAARRFMWSVISRISTQRQNSSVILTTHSMEEAEALSTRIAIQVEGQLKCIGTVQQIKNKFGEGYEVECKLKLPSNDQLVQTLKTDFNFDGKEIQNIHVFPNNLQENLAKLNAMEYYDLITKNEQFAQIYSRIKSSIGVSLLNLYQFILLENLGSNLQKFIKQNLGEYSIIEHFDDFYRFRIESKISIGKMFENFENNKQNLSILNYSVKQASIEQIFNLFAQNKIKVNQKVHNLPGKNNLPNEEDPQQQNSNSSGQKSINIDILK
ncbi:ABC transporter family protein (macronuclear) [Tetrahymena thermophila SB210]|uniref:ABC transporter family protein n=1 Tax=Tetrahymena thermophila (strain SB210) TaxID=312017 RepID=Q22NA0_TETTS|nr:ABC transporter family protein [Tetrahymena thermophila SB210]EAR86885.2 ABC transporter family protein [Tetrahymena thermophila SB210]|eukprot:XP_001007130.2 ABC transporter family protein [Tetrahymena thermophila SB210]